MTIAHPVSGRWCWCKAPGQCFPQAHTTHPLTQAPETVNIQSKSSIQVTWPVLANSRSVFRSRDHYWPIPCHLVWPGSAECPCYPDLNLAGVTIPPHPALQHPWHPEQVMARLSICRGNVSKTAILFLAPSGPQGVTMSVCLSVSNSKALNLSLSGSDLQAALLAHSRLSLGLINLRTVSLIQQLEPKIILSLLPRTVGAWNTLSCCDVTENVIARPLKLWWHPAKLC